MVPARLAEEGTDSIVLAGSFPETQPVPFIARTASM
jgi:hypothetical protein